MAQVYECKMITVVTVNICADSAEEAQDWINTHSIEDVKAETTAYDIGYDDQVIGEVNEEAAIDISDKPNEDEDRIVSATYTSVWDGGIEITTNCKVNIDTGEVFDVEKSEVIGIDILEREYITINNEDFDVSDDPTETYYWHE